MKLVVCLGVCGMCLAPAQDLSHPKLFKNPKSIATTYRVQENAGKVAGVLPVPEEHLGKAGCTVSAPPSHTHTRTRTPALPRAHTASVDWAS